MEKMDAVELILAQVDYDNMIHIAGGHPMEGQFVVTGPTSGGNENRIGYCVQVRKGRGQFHSDMVFLRHIDGTIITHENQCYIGMTKEQERLARSIFNKLPENEDHLQGYRCCGNVLEIGFVIENSVSEPIPDHPFTITICSK